MCVCVCVVRLCPPVACVSPFSTNNNNRHEWSESLSAITSLYCVCDIEIVRLSQQLVVATTNQTTFSHAMHIAHTLCVTRTRAASHCASQHFNTHSIFPLWFCMLQHRAHTHTHTVCIERTVQALFTCGGHHHILRCCWLRAQHHHSSMVCAYPSKRSASCALMHIFNSDSVDMYLNKSMQILI